MARVFISHAAEDGRPAAELHDWLVAEGHEVFLDLHPLDGETPAEFKRRRDELDATARQASSPGVEIAVMEKRTATLMSPLVS